MGEREDLPLIGMPDDSKKGETKARTAKGGVATVGAPKSESDKPIHRRETTRLPSPIAARMAPKPAPAKPVTSAEKANAAAETAVDEDFGPTISAPPPAPEHKPKPMPPSETDPELMASPSVKPALISKPTVVLKGDPAKAEAKPAVISEPTSRRENVLEDDPEELLLHLQKRVREAKGALGERDEARTKAARLEHELAQAKEQVAILQPLEPRVKDLQAKLDAAMLAAHDAGRSAERVKELEAQVKQLEDRTKAAESAQKKGDNALANAKEARDEAQRRIEAALAALQGKQP